MSNHASTIIHFEGSKTKLQEIEKLLIRPGTHSDHEINFSYVDGKVPGIDNKFVYQLFGCDWNKYLRKEYNTEEMHQFNQKVAQLVKSQKWIGLRDAYVNRSQDVSSQHLENKLVIRATFNWYCPTLFFAKIAEDFGVNVKILEFIEGNETVISYIDKKGDCVDVKNSLQSIIENQDFRDLSVELGLHKPAELAAVALFVGAKPLVKQLIKDYDINSDQMSFAINEMIKFGEDNWDIYQSSAFVGLDTNKLKNINSMELMHEFAKIEDKAKEELHPKKLK